MASFVTDVATFSPTAATPPDQIAVNNPYTAIKIDTTGTIELYNAPRPGVTPTTVGASEYAGGVWHYVLFSGVVAADAVIQVGRVCETDKSMGLPHR